MIKAVGKACITFDKGSLHFFYGRICLCRQYRHILKNIVYDEHMERRRRAKKNKQFGLVRSSKGKMERKKFLQKKNIKNETFRCFTE